MRVVAYPADLGGCGHHRVIWPARALQAEGVDVDVVLRHEPAERQLRGSWWNDDDGNAHLVDVLAPEADVVVVQRPATDRWVATIHALQRKGIRVVVEVDDDFDTIHPRNVAWARFHPTASPGHNRLHVHEACRIADWVVVSTPALARRYGAHGRCSVVRNCVPARYLDATREPHDGVYVGWSGSVETHPADLQEMGAALVRALRATGAELAVVGTGTGVQRIVGTPEPPLAAGWRTIAEYPDALAQFDVGVVPLQPGAFNEAKSWLTGLAMAACGVPFVASPTIEYTALHAAGAGLIASTPRDWERHLKTLIGSPALREDLAELGRRVARSLTIQSRAERWWEAWIAPLAAPAREVLHAR